VIESSRPSGSFRWTLTRGPEVAAQDLREALIRGNALPRPCVPVAVEHPVHGPIATATVDRLGQEESRLIAIALLRTEQGLGRRWATTRGQGDVLQEEVPLISFQELGHRPAEQPELSELVLYGRGHWIHDSYEAAPPRTWLTKISLPLMETFSVSLSSTNWPFTTSSSW